MEVVILDTGINSTHPYLEKTILGGCSVIGKKEDYADDNGHGTLCASVIKKESPKTKMWVIKVLDQNNETTIEKLKKALALVEKIPIRLIHLSLSILEEMDDSEIHRMIQRLYESGKIVVCSLENGRSRSCPAVYPEVLGVRGSVLESEYSFWYEEKRAIQCVADSNSYLHAYLQGSYRLFGKNNSFAAAKITGILASIWEDDPELSRDEVLARFSGRAVRKWYGEKDLEQSLRFPEKTEKTISEEILKKTEETVRDFLKVPITVDLENQILFWKQVGLNKTNSFLLIRRLEDVFSVKIRDYTGISRYDLCFLKNLAGVMADELKSDAI